MELKNQAHIFIARIKAYTRLMRMDRPIGSFLLLWPTLWALWIAASGLPPLRYLLIFVAGVFLTRAAGCTINDIADRQIDKEVKRTNTRPLAQRIISVRGAFVLLIVLLLSALALVSLTNQKSILLASAGALMMIIYPFTKRFSYFPQVFLGATWSIGILLAFTVLNRGLPTLAWLLFFAHIFLTVAYDTAYAMVDQEDDRRIGVKSTALLFGKHAPLIITLLQIAFLITMMVVALYTNLGYPYWAIGIAGSGLLFYYQYYLLQNPTPENCFRVFLNNNWVGFVMFLGVVLGYLSP